MIELTAEDFDCEELEAIAFHAETVTAIKRMEAYCKRICAINSSVARLLLHNQSVQLDLRNGVYYPVEGK